MPRYARRPSGQRRLPGPWKHGPLPVVGLVGGIGAGKSRVASELAARGAAVLDADAIGHALLDQRPSRNAVVARFGEDVLDASAGEAEEPKIDRAALGGIVFAAPHALRALESILHPRMRSTFEKAIRRVGRRREAPMVVLDAAVLFEAGWDDLCDAIVFVDAPDRVRRARIAESRGWTGEQLAAREASQWPLGRKREQSDHVLNNHGTPEELAARLDALWRVLTRRPDVAADPAGRGDLRDRDEPNVESERPMARSRRLPPGPGRPGPGGPRGRGRSRRKR
ncbi:dephospho-CoA kinase [Tautonia sp. JC769]|uniref:dephospho-CoA kinase n=1 Tax=Tautonia sp. JC769 TaxID=3232135 RepID=UPI003458BDFB